MPKNHYYRCEYETPVFSHTETVYENVTVATPSKHNDKKSVGSNQTQYE